MPERKHPGYYFADLLSDIMGREKVSKMYVDLIKKQKLVSEINAYITGSIDEGLFIITGKLNEGKTFSELDKEIWKIIEHYCSTLITKKELDQIKIKLRTARAFQDQGLLNRAMNLSFFELLGDANGINEEHEIYQSIQAEDLRTFAKQMFTKKNGVLLKVKKKKHA
jgi:predicted Zn-dependent peptidase